MTSEGALSGRIIRLALVKSVRKLATRAKVDHRDLSALIAWFTAQDFRWSQGTLAQYRGALQHELERAALDHDQVQLLRVELKRGPIPLPKGSDKTGCCATRSDGSVQSYRARVPQLFAAAGVEPNDHEGAVRWFSGAHFRWKPSTIVQYRAVLRQAIEDAALDPEVAQYLEYVLEQGPLPRNSGPPRTSARKRKSLPQEEFAKLIKQLQSPGGHPDDRLAAQLLGHNVLLFLRRVEWETAAVQEGHLVIQNAKATNGRSIGPQRRRDLSDYGERGVRSLRGLIRKLETRSKEIEDEEGEVEDVDKPSGFSILWARLSSRIARACKKAGIKRVSIYTTRHVGMANAKSWMPPEAVAASAGHKTTATAASHYAKRRSGWGAKVKQVARPAPEDVEKVIRSPKCNRQANIEYIAKRNNPKKDAPEHEVKNEGPEGDTPEPDNDTSTFRF